jgi:formate/nitrite transporter FocA (FNT family)
MPIFSAQVQQSMIQIGVEHFGSGFGIVLIRAIFAGWLIALMVWLLPAAEHSRVSIIIILTYLIGLAGFNHVIAGSTKIFFLAIIGRISWAAYATQFFLPTVIGNVIGGVTLVAALAHAQVLGGLDSQKGNKSVRQSG